VSALEITFAPRMADIPKSDWDSLAAPYGNPLLSWGFLALLEASGSMTPETGWTGAHALARRDGVLVAAAPFYIKTHSWGEFVFDWAWADAYQRHGLRYYPKWICAVPFTPVAGARLLGATAQIRAELIDAALEHAKTAGVSSLHCLFPTQDQALEMQARGMLLRRGVQFHWRNPGYAAFDDYLAELRHDKRKKIRQERRKVAEAGIRFEQLRGEHITDAHWQHFVACYTCTHRQFDSSPHLNLDFFRRIGAAMPDKLLLIVASQAGRPIASALNLYSRDTLYGRSWGSLEYHPGLHFETCYYQAIEFCIANRIASFEGGAQGEHKLARGFLPVTTWSAHWLAHPEFARAVEDHLQREAGGMARYMDELNESNPFRRSPPSRAERST